MSEEKKNKTDSNYEGKDLTKSVMEDTDYTNSNLERSRISLIIVKRDFEDVLITSIYSRCSIDKDVSDKSSV